ERYLDFVSDFVAGAPKKKKGFRGGDAAAIGAKGHASRREAAAKASASEDVPCDKAVSDDGASVAGPAVVDEMANSAGTEMLVGSGVSDPATSSSTKPRCWGDALDDPECAWPIEDCFDEAPVGGIIEDVPFDGPEYAASATCDDRNVLTAVASNSRVRFCLDDPDDDWPCDFGAADEVVAGVGVAGAFLDEAEAFGDDVVGRSAVNASSAIPAVAASERRVSASSVLDDADGGLPV
ncbi:MAG: hypothetical protein GY903_06135, partial [Fuerstiella sp.]|nr:hypothetical protein [Fuerstiella sp.]